MILVVSKNWMFFFLLNCTLVEMVVSFLGRSINLSDEDVFNGFVSYLRDFFDVENT